MGLNNSGGGLVMALLHLGLNSIAIKMNLTVFGMTWINYHVE